MLEKQLDKELIKILNEMPSPKENKQYNYDTAEFLGDAVLRLFITLKLKAEGKFTSAKEVNNFVQYFGSNYKLAKFYDAHREFKELQVVKEKADRIEAFISMLFSAHHFSNKNMDGAFKLLFGQKLSNFLEEYYKQSSSANDKMEGENAVNTFSTYVKRKTGKDLQTFYTVEENNKKKVCVINFSNKTFIGEGITKKQAIKNACKTGCGYFKIPYAGI